MINIRSYTFAQPVSICNSFLEKIISAYKFSSGYTLEIEHKIRFAQYYACLFQRCGYSALSTAPVITGSAFKSARWGNYYKRSICHPTLEIFLYGRKPIDCHYSIKRPTSVRTPCKAEIYARLGLSWALCRFSLDSLPVITCWNTPGGIASYEKLSCMPFAEIMECEMQGAEKQYVHPETESCEPLFCAST